MSSHVRNGLKKISLFIKMCDYLFKLRTWGVDDTGFPPIPSLQVSQVSSIPHMMTIIETVFPASHS